MGNRVSDEIIEIGGTGCAVTTYCQFCGTKRFSRRAISILQNPATTLGIIKSDPELLLSYDKTIYYISCNNIACKIKCLSNDSSFIDYSCGYNIKIIEEINEYNDNDTLEKIFGILQTICIPE